MVPTAKRGAITPDEADKLDLAVVAALLGLSRDRVAWESDWERMRAMRVQAAKEGRRVTWADLESMPN